MPIRVQIPTPMREQAGGKSEVEVSGPTVQAALDDLVKKHPGLGPKLFDNGKLRPYVNVFVNDATSYNVSGDAGTCPPRSWNPRPFSQIVLPSSTMMPERPGTFVKRRRASTYRSKSATLRSPV